MPKDHLATLVFDGRTLRFGSIKAFEPATLKWVRTKVLKLRESDEEAARGAARLTNLITASVTLNALLLALLVLLAIRRGK